MTADLPEWAMEKAGAALGSPAERVETWDQIKKRHVAEVHEAIIAAVRRAGGNRSLAARRLGIDRGAMLRLIRDNGLSVGDRHG
jgi:transcriptional regulator of acetoin/glycerol metabolism